MVAERCAVPASRLSEDATCDADHPGDLTERGWLDVLARLAHSLREDGMWLRSAGVAFCAIFVAIPGASVAMAVFGLLANPDAVHRPIEMLGGLVPGNATLFLADQMQAVARTSRMQLGAGLGGGLIAALWGAWSGASGLIAALNVAYGEEEARSFLRRAWDAFVVALAAGLFMVLAFAVVAMVPLVLSLVPLSPAMQTAASIARWPALALLCIAALGMLYRFAPCRRAAKWRWVSPGAAVGTALWLVCSTGFSFYVSHFPSYNQTLGLLGIIMMLLTWSYLSAFAVLLGAELNAELERQTSRDTTTGPARRLGERGAAVADTKIQAAEKRG
ncbi:YihY/virulence factor BrkB family protein [Microvirga tunisiensis]|uniref:YihY/virulence factor BrkB family protein n=1 Tax=Microvirga tunisiensis TaxID=2108360 RepID=A0A5N7MQE2_9HYPH|nr:YihY/virulence factor BrkB family protein [Microvirga tunisiensis]MPR11830.1 YihY/virulence factor BrkB family protein [Microvirga tunisiensis]MPR29237.1 YihY/virulence factor BrkB family protein [Microvirga tunisiensis]